MKLQYLGDYRDAFKWDLLHWLCSRALPPFKELVIVPLLTPDDTIPRDGQIHHRQFVAREFIHDFVGELRQTPRTLSRVTRLGCRPSQARFAVTVYRPELLLPPNESRKTYWQDLSLTDHQRTVVFCDPDNGFETRTRSGQKWVRHSEIADLLHSLPLTSAVVVYQHRPRRHWLALFADLARSFDDYAPFACAAHDHNLALIALTRGQETASILARTLMIYAQSHPRVAYQNIKNTTM